jgi:tRNA U54 and U55 pseudouridine synthase Pus10
MPPERYEGRIMRLVRVQTVKDIETTTVDLAEYKANQKGESRLFVKELALPQASKTASI